VNSSVNSKIHNLLNFSGGPGALPESVLRQVKIAIEAVPEVGLSILGISHRSKWFTDLIIETEERIRSLLNLSMNYHVLFLQGGATQQFSTIAMAFDSPDGFPADYLDTGYWSGKSIQGATLFEKPNINVAWSGSSNNYTKLPNPKDLNLNPAAPYFHYVSNETVEGLQFQKIVGLESVPRFCDMSSDFLSSPISADKYSLIYAHAQKNLGPAGVTIVVIKDEMLKKINGNMPTFLDYRTHVESHSNFNTPPVFAIYVVSLVTKWLFDDIGGLKNMAEINNAKAQTIYHEIDDSDSFYQNKISPKDRSKMNISFKLASPMIEKEFLKQAQAAGFSGLEGHRSIGGIRASLYNGVTLDSAEQLAAFLKNFKKTHQKI
jgi:phosphoserine aminotransferase